MGSIGNIFYLYLVGVTQLEIKKLKNAEKIKKQAQFYPLSLRDYLLLKDAFNQKSNIIRKIRRITWDSN